MPLETGTYISDLVVTNPAHSDGLNQADSHVRLIKSTVKTTFPNITGAVNATHTQLNSLLSQLLGTTAYTAPQGTVAAVGHAFIGDLGTGMYSPATGRVAFAMGGADALNFAADKTANFAAGATFAAPITGPGVIPIGGMIMWLTDTLPTGNGVWAWANGGALSRTTAGAGKELFALWGTTYGTGDGSTTFNVINMQEVVPVGKSTMGGGTSPGLLASISSSIKGALAGLFGNDTTTLATGNLPPYTPSGSVVTTTSSSNAAAQTLQYPAQNTNAVGVGGNLSGGSFVAPGFTSTSTFTGNAQGGASTPFSNLGPSRVVNFIIRIA